MEAIRIALRPGASGEPEAEGVVGVVGVVAGPVVVGVVAVVVPGAVVVAVVVVVVVGGVVVLVVVVVVGGVVVVVVVVPVVVVPVVVVPVVVPAPCTTIVAVMNACRSQWNVYVPGVLNVHVPLHPGPVAECGSGGTAPLDAPAVCVHELGCGPVPKSALWALEPLG